MKWVYLPIMFALAFMYTKFSFSDLGNKVSSAADFAPTVLRAPASIEESVVKVEAVKRVSSAVLFKNLDDGSLMNVFQKVSAFKGTIVGNPHVESFGFVVDDKGHASFSISEFQDASEGAYFHDVLGHMISAKTIDKKINWLSYFEAYKAGLQGVSHRNSFYIEKGLENAVWTSEKTFEENVTGDFPFEFTQLKKSHQKVGAVKKSMIQDALRKKFPKIQFFDLYESNSLLNHFEILVRVRPQDKIQWISMNESSLCDYDQAFNQETKSIPFARRFELVKTDIFDNKLKHSLEAVEIDKKSYFLKFSDHFSSKLQLNEIPSDDYLDIIYDEAYVLGSIHKRSLGERSDDYIKSWATISGAMVDEKVIELKYKLKDLQK